jgi:hypothetical protein
MTTRMAYFAASFYRGLGLDPSAYEGRYDPRAAFAEKDVSRGELDKVVPYGELARPFEEVFADAFAAFALADPKAVATALRDCGHFNLRDFDEPYDASSWDEGDLKPFVIRLPAPNPYESRSSTEGPPFYVVTPNVQEVLSPLRSAVWRAYTRLKSRGVTRPGAIVLKAIHCAAVIVARDQHDSGVRYRSWFTIPRPKYNKLAIKRFDECMVNAAATLDEDREQSPPVACLANLYPRAKPACGKPESQAPQFATRECRTPCDVN